MLGEDGHPRASRDYPGDWHELLAWFPDDAACRAYLERLRWPEGFVCPACGERGGWRTGRGLWLCRACRRTTSVTAGTIFEGTRTPLRTWLAACWCVTSQRQGASALGLGQALSLGSYQTAWAMLHRLRRAMVRSGRKPLGGVVEVDESYVGGEEEGVQGRETDTKAIVAIACEVREPRGFGRVRLRRVDDVSAASLVPFVRDVVAPGATARTDGWGAYKGLARAGYQHRRTVISATGDPAHVSMPGVHRVASLLKRWLLGTHQGSVSNEHLDAYLGEFSFRFNRRSSRRRGLLFYRLLEQAVATEPAPYRALIADRPRPQDVVVG